MRYQHDNYLFVIRPDGSLQYCRPAEWRQIRKQSLTLSRFLGAAAPQTTLRAVQVSLPGGTCSGSRSGAQAAPEVLLIDQFCLRIGERGELLRVARVGQRYSHRASSDFAGWCTQSRVSSVAQLTATQANPPLADIAQQLLQDYIGGMLCGEGSAPSRDDLPSTGKSANAAPASTERLVAVGAEKWQQTDAFADELRNVRRACA